MMDLPRLTLIAATLCAAAAGPLAAQQAPEPRPAPPEAAPSLIDQGARLLLRGLLDELAPQLEAADLPGKLALMQQLGALLAEADQFDPPQVLPNGDILIRRKPKDLAPPQIDTGPDGEIDL